MDKEQLIQGLQGIVTQLSQYAEQHRLQAIVFEDQGFTKLREKYNGHAQEEIGFVEQFAQRILDLGGEVKLEDKKAMPIYKDPIEFIKFDLELSKEAQNPLLELVNGSMSEPKTYDLLRAYYEDEEEDKLWSENELELIEKIGEQNWLQNQL
ncbi:ferritin-like domain-containing protein [Anaerococcus urinomassiliensis]|uniref:ferritin-like domain-containing protein n=1 Tax=Anaerococcus urinomassiliensis TaxID=1745712 RepID=UPI00093E4624|nr:ferritin-like domain-containing protein [Anaerococcus urinomassiliensis]